MKEIRHGHAVIGFAVAHLRPYHSTPFFFRIFQHPLVAIRGIVDMTVLVICHSSSLGQTQGGLDIWIRHPCEDDPSKLPLI
jgi:hypothetical protein